MQRSQQRLIPYFADLENKVVLDVGAGTGLYRSLVPASARYVGLDIDVENLIALRHKSSFPVEVVACDATRLSLAARSVHAALCIGVLHHLPDAGVKSLLQELQRVVTEKLLVLEPVYASRSVASRILWSCDRGSHPRSANALIKALSPFFDPQLVNRYSICHRYLFCIARTRSTSS